MTATPPNLHGTALVIGDRGIFIRGRSGSGKTALALELLARASSFGRHARLVADDQLFAEAHGGRLVMIAPASIEGLVEVRGFGVRPIAWQPRAVIDLAVTLVDPAEVQRIPDPAVIELCAVALPELKAAARNVADAASVVSAELRLGLFDTVHMRQNG